MNLKKRKMQSSNILYLTKNCNLRCSYCFERERHRNESISFSGIDSFLDDVIRREPDSVSTICLFGGEPFLEFEKLRYVLEKCERITKETGKQFAFSTITNGTLLHNYIDELRLFNAAKSTKFSLIISYDGNYQKYRETSGIVEKNLNLLLENDIPFGISYSVLEYNSDRKILISELVRIIKKYFLRDKREYLRINFDIEKIENKYNCSFDEYLKGIQEHLFLLYKYYRVPICHLVCKICGRCKKDNFSDEALSCIPDGDSIIIRPEKTSGPFDHF